MSQVPVTDALAWHALYPRDPVGQFWRQQSVIGGLDSELSDGLDPHIDFETAPSPRDSRATRQAATVDFVKPGRGSWPYQAKNSLRPRL